MSEPEITESAKTTLGIRVTDELREKIREAARLEQRTESSFARFYLGRAADAILGKPENEPEGKPA